MRYSFIACALMLALTVPQAFAALEYDVRQDVIYGHKAGMGLTFDVVTPRENSNGIGLLCMMSRGWNSTWTPTDEMMRQSAITKGRFASVVSEGFTLFFVWHGSEPQFKVPDVVSDVRRAVRYIRHHSEDFSVDPERLGVFGASAGGHLSLILGTTADDGDTESDDPVERESSRVAAVVAYFPPVDLRKSVGLSPALDFDPEFAEAVSPVLHATSDDAPALMIHGDLDKTVPISQSEQMFQALSKAGVDADLLIIKGAGHAFRGSDAGKAAAAQVAWFKKHLLD
jgi:dienelactone hydrolase